MAAGMIIILLPSLALCLQCGGRSVSGGISILIPPRPFTMCVISTLPHQQNKDINNNTSSWGLRKD